MNQINKITIVLLMLVTITTTSAQVEIRASDGTELPPVTYVGDKLTVQILDDGIPVVSGAVVLFTLDNPDIAPVEVNVNDFGEASYKPYVRGKLTIQVFSGVDALTQTSIVVDDEPWVPDIPWTPDTTSTPKPTVEPTVAPTAVPTVEPTVVPTLELIAENVTVSNETVNYIVPRQTIEPVVPEPVVERTEVIEVVATETPPKMKNLPESSSIPGFEAIFAIAGILGAVYLYHSH